MQYLFSKNLAAVPLQHVVPESLLLEQKLAPTIFVGDAKVKFLSHACRRASFTLPNAGMQAASDPSPLPQRHGACASQGQHHPAGGP